MSREGLCDARQGSGGAAYRNLPERFVLLEGDDGVARELDARDEGGGERGAGAGWAWPLG
jgi:hypothetical protein